MLKKTRIIYTIDNANILNDLFCGRRGEVKSLWSIFVGLHMRYKVKNKEVRKRKFKQILKN